jgi:hypothetical protein
VKELDDHHGDADMLLYSIVLGTIAHRIWPIHDEEYFVLSMRSYRKVYVECEIVIIPRRDMGKHVKNTKIIGILMPCDMQNSLCLGFEDCYDAQRKSDFHGCPMLITQFMLMMMHLHHQAMHLHPQIHTKIITLLHHTFIVWKQLLLHVVLSLLGPSSLRQSLPQISSGGWNLSIPHQTCVQTIFALTKPVLSFALLLAMVPGICGKRHLNLLLTHITISIIAPQIIFVENGAIQLH